MASVIVIDLPRLAVPQLLRIIILIKFLAASPVSFFKPVACHCLPLLSWIIECRINGSASDSQSRRFALSTLIECFFAACNRANCARYTLWVEKVIVHTIVLRFRLIVQFFAFRSKNVHSLQCRKQLKVKMNSGNGE